MKILVTGGAGYIGSHTAKALHAAGHTPVTLDNLVYGHECACKWGPLEKGDLADRDFILKTLRKHGIDSVIHFAAFAYVGESMSDPRKYFRNNFVNTLNLLDAMLDTGVKKIVFSSTCATYGVPTASPIAESHSQAPVNPYGETKYFTERVLQWYESAYGLKWVALRYFNAAGADPDGEVGEDHTPESHLIPLAIEAAQGKRPHMEIFGTDYPTPDGSAVRDYIHVTDLADAHVRALKHLDAGASLALNLGTGEGRSVREVLDSVARVSGRKFPIKELPRRAGDPPALIADARKARETLGWTPRYTDLDTIVGHAWKWHERKK